MYIVVSGVSGVGLSFWDVCAPLAGALGPPADPGAVPCVWVLLRVTLDMQDE